jgi:hypothetical protein
VAYLAQDSSLCLSTSGRRSFTCTKFGCRRLDLLRLALAILQDVELRNQYLAI